MLHVSYVDDGNVVYAVVTVNQGRKVLAEEERITLSMYYRCIHNGSLKVMYVASTWSNCVMDGGYVLKKS